MEARFFAGLGVSTMTDTRVLLVDDHAVIREGLRELLNARTDMVVVGEAGDGREAVEAVERLAPDVAVMDVWLPRLSGIAATEEIRKASPQTGVVVLSVHAELRFVENALRAGATGYVVKSAAAKELIAAIGAVREGKRYLSPEVAEGLVERVIHPGEAEPGPLAALSTREREILQRLAEGLSAKEIAADLHISTRTAETHRANVMRKLDVRKTTSLVRIAIREGLLAP